MYRPADTRARGVFCKFEASKYKNKTIREAIVRKECASGSRRPLSASCRAASILSRKPGRLLARKHFPNATRLGACWHSGLSYGTMPQVVKPTPNLMTAAGQKRQIDDVGHEPGLPPIAAELRPS